MRGRYTVNGIVNDFNGEGDLFRKEKLTIMVTKDKLGCTVSVESEKTGVMYSFDFDQILKDLTKGR